MPRTPCADLKLCCREMLQIQYHYKIVACDSRGRHTHQSHVNTYLVAGQAALCVQAQQYAGSLMSLLAMVSNRNRFLRQCRASRLHHTPKCAPNCACLVRHLKTGVLMLHYSTQNHHLRKQSFLLELCSQHMLLMVNAQLHLGASMPAITGKQANHTTQTDHAPLVELHTRH